MSFIRRGTPREHPFPEFISCRRCGSATGGVIDELCASCDGRIADSIAGRPRTTTIRGTPAPAPLPADSIDEDTIVVDPPTLCEMLAAFADGELDAEQAQTFRDHLAGCSACETDLLEQMQLEARLLTLLPR